MRLTSDLIGDGNELRKIRFEEGTALPTDPFFGQLFHLHIPGQISKVFFFDGTQWICGATSVAGRQGDVVLTKADVGLDQVDNLKQQPWSPSLTDMAADLDPPAPPLMAAMSPEQAEQIRGLGLGDVKFLLKDSFTGKWELTDVIPQANLGGIIDLTGATDAVPGDVLQFQLPTALNPGGWDNRSLTQYKADLNLNNVDNTSDANKPVSTAQAAANTADRARANHTGTQLASTISDFSTASDARITMQKAAANGIATLNSVGQIPSAQLPPLVITSTFVVNSQAAQLALTTQEGDVAIRSDLPATFIRNAGLTGTMTDWNQIATPTDLILSVNGKTGVVVLTKTDVGLSNIDNTSDVNKPVSTAQAAADALKVNKTGDTMTGLLTASGGVKVPDASFTIYDNVDTTKQAQFEVAPVATGTTRTYSLPNANGTVLLDTTAQTPIYKISIVTTTNYQILVTEYLILMGGDGLVLKLPAASAVVPGRSFMIKSTFKGCTVTSPNGGTIDNTASASIPNLGAKAFISDGTNWWVL